MENTTIGLLDRAEPGIVVHLVHHFAYSRLQTKLAECINTRSQNTFSTAKCVTVMFSARMHMERVEAAYSINTLIVGYAA